MLPEHLVVQEILERAYDDLPIDTRRHFGIGPRRLAWGEAHDVLSRHLEERAASGCPHENTIDEDYDFLASAQSSVDCSGEWSSRRFDHIDFIYYVCWDKKEKRLFYSMHKDWRWRSGYKIGRYITTYQVAWSVEEYWEDGTVCSPYGPVSFRICERSAGSVVP